MNPNCLLAVLFLFLYPVLVLLSIIRQRSYIAVAYEWASKLLARKKVFAVILIAELAVWIYNIIMGV